MDVSILAIFLVKKTPTKSNKRTKTVQTSKQNPKASVSCLLRMKLGAVAVYLELLWDRGCHEGRVVHNLTHGRGVCRARCRKPFHQRRAAVTGRQLSLDPPPGLQGAVSLLLSLRRRTPIAGEFCAILPWTRNFLIVLGKLTYKLSLCTYDTE